MSAYISTSKSEFLPFFFLRRERHENIFELQPHQVAHLQESAKVQPAAGGDDVVEIAAAEFVERGRAMKLEGGQCLGASNKVGRKVKVK